MVQQTVVYTRWPQRLLYTAAPPPYVPAAIWGVISEFMPADEVPNLKRLCRAVVLPAYALEWARKRHEAWLFAPLVSYIPGLDIHQSLWRRWVLENDIRRRNLADILYGNVYNVNLAVALIRGRNPNVVYQRRHAGIPPRLRYSVGTTANGLFIVEGRMTVGVGVVGRMCGSVWTRYGVSENVRVVERMMPFNAWYAPDWSRSHDATLSIIESHDQRKRTLLLEWVRFLVDECLTGSRPSFPLTWKLLRELVWVLDGVWMRDPPPPPPLSRPVNVPKWQCVQKLKRAVKNCMLN
jgi:hypothetical protein